MLFFDEESTLIDNTMTKNSAQSISIQKKNLLSQQKGLFSSSHAL